MQVKLQIWDTAGQERFRTITVSYFKGAHGIILLYDVTDMETFESIRNWIQQVRVGEKKGGGVGRKRVQRSAESVQTFLVELVQSLTQGFLSPSALHVQIHDHADAAVNIVLVGNKCDGNVHGRSREVSREEGQALADEYGLKFFETSAKQNIGVEETFEAIARETKDRLQTEAAERAKMKKKDDRKKDGGTISLGAPTSEPSKRSRARCRC